MKCFAPLAVLVLGVLVVFGTLLYSVFSVGVPSPDPTPAIAAAEAHVEHVSHWGLSAGLILILIGTACLCICRLLRRRASDARHDGPVEARGMGN